MAPHLALRHTLCALCAKPTHSTRPAARLSQRGPENSNPPPRSTATRGTAQICAYAARADMVKSLPSPASRLSEPVKMTRTKAKDGRESACATSHSFFSSESCEGLHAYSEPGETRAADSIEGNSGGKVPRLGPELLLTLDVFCAEPATHACTCNFPTTQIVP